MKGAGDECEMKMLVDAEMMLEKGHEILFLLPSTVIRQSAARHRSKRVTLFVVPVTVLVYKLSLES
jgi:hypothetical protein